MKRETFYPINIGLHTDAATRTALASLARKKQLTVPALIREIIFDALMTKRFAPNGHQAKRKRVKRG